MDTITVMEITTAIALSLAVVCLCNCLRTKNQLVLSGDIQKVWEALLEIQRKIREARVILQKDYKNNNIDIKEIKANFDKILNRPLLTKVIKTSTSVIITEVIITDSFNFLSNNVKKYEMEFSQYLCIIPRDIRLKQDIQAKLGTVVRECEVAQKSMDDTCYRLKHAQNSDSGAIRAVDTYLQAIQKSLGEAITLIRDVYEDLQRIQTCGSVLMRLLVSVLLGIGLPLLGWYGLSRILGSNFPPDTWLFILLAGIAWFVSYGIAMALATTMPSTASPSDQMGKHAHLSVLVCFILLVLIGSALSYTAIYIVFGPNIDTKMIHSLRVIFSLLLIAVGPFMAFITLYGSPIQHNKAETISVS